MTGMIEQGTVLTDENARMIEGSTGMITETNEAEYTANGRRKHSKERVKDSRP